MQTPFLRWIQPVAALVLASPSFAGDSLSALDHEADASNSPWVFSVLPRSLQKTPRVELTVMTEMTDAGRGVPAPTASAPLYYRAKNSGFHQEGQGPATRKPTAEALAALTKRLKAGLAQNHFLPSDDLHPPSQILFYVWGAHAGAYDTLRDGGIRATTSRAQLIAGKKFADELYRAMADQSHELSLKIGFLDPVHRLSERDALTRHIIEQARSECYFVVVSSYDAAALARGERRLLWRTKMVTSADGLALGETLPVLAAGGAGFFGRETDGPRIVPRVLRRDGRVEIGRPIVQEFVDGPKAETL